MKVRLGIFLVFLGGLVWGGGRRMGVGENGSCVSVGFLGDRY